MSETENTAVSQETTETETTETRSRYVRAHSTASSYAFGGDLAGRREIFTPVETITRDNVMSVLRQAVQTHEMNRYEIEYLYKYYRGMQPILGRTKEVRPDINNKIVVNTANEIVSFKVGYLFGDPVAYAGRAEDDCSDAIQELNRYMSAVDKEAQDAELALWMHICGVGYRMCMPNTEMTEDNESPFDLYTLDPRTTFIVKHAGLKKKPVMAVMFVDVPDDMGAINRLYSVYTNDRYFLIREDEIVEETVNILGIPIIEYPLNMPRMGAFETVIPLLDAQNELASNRMDSVAQFVQALILFHNVDIDADGVAKLQALGAIKYKDVDPTMQGEVKYITAELNQEGSHTLKEDLYESILIICGMPNRNGGSSTSDTGSAVVLRDGWNSAETRAKETEKWFSRSEKNMLRIALKICREKGGIDIHLSNVEIKFTRRNYENIITKATVLTTMLGCEKVAPRLAFVQSGMFPDPEAAYAESEKYYEEHKEEAIEYAEGSDTNEGTDTDNRNTAEER